MACKDDLELARALQAEYDRETAQELDTNEEVLFDPSSFSAANGAFSHHQGPIVSANESMSIVDERWELLDPSPDVRAMFMEFNDRYFWGRLAGVEVRWSPRMTLCAGLCCYEGRGGLCSIRLSTPLLKLRPRKDLVETLLHEMIHAYLFVTENNKDHDGHGPEFCKHMKRINTATGTNITIYHSFHDEVDVYRQHWWKCNGPCQKKPPYFGIVKRAMNRPPAPRDTWWAEHQKTCGGTYTKIKEPEGYGDKKKGNKRKKEDRGDNSEGAKGAKRQATDSSDMASLNFPGKGNVLGSETSSKPLTPLQTWIAEQRKNQNDTSLSTSKTKPPSSLGASPSKHSSNPDGSNKQANPEPTPLQKWISKISDKTKSSSSTSISSPSGKRNGKHVRKGSGRRDALLAIFDSDSDSDDFFPSTGMKSSPTAGDPLTSRSSNANSNKAIDIFPHSSLGSTQSRNTTSATTNHPGAFSSGYPGLPSTRTKFDTSSKSKVASPVNQQNPVRSRGDSSKSKVTSPSKQQSPTKNTIEGAFANVRQRSGDAGSSGSGISFTAHTNSTFGSNASVTTLDLTGSAGEHSMPIATRTVQCPVCGTSVIETNINTHLDMCLT